MLGLDGIVFYLVSIYCVKDDNIKLPRLGLTVKRPV